ncbi:MAG: nucleoside monophosphate kinase [Chthoniobacterales bacterium]|nr:nucleoside monophosphate kinase [Chthoniobacterales bacterium]
MVPAIVSTKYATYLFFGAPGSGKGTQGTTLGTLPRFFHCACGDVFRRMDTRSPLGKAFLKYSSKGRLVPDEITVELWKESIAHVVESGAFKPDIDYLVLDGIPRNVRQAELMSEIIAVKRVFHLHCADVNKVVARLKKRALKDNRLDDANEDVIRRRLETYRKESLPLLDFFGPDLIVEVDATEPPVVVMQTILSHIVKDRVRPGDFTEQPDA